MINEKLFKSHYDDCNLIIVKVYYYHIGLRVLLAAILRVSTDFLKCIYLNLINIKFIL